VEVLARDVDAQAALDLSQGVAESAGGLVWQTRTGDVRYADNLHRRRAVSALIIDTCQILVTPTWQRNTQGLINKVSLGYGGAEATAQDQNDQSITRYGTYSYSLTTELAALADAQAIAGLLVARNAKPVWTMADLPVAVKDLSDADTITLLQ